jgi:methylmalonyl-CoA mutase
MSDNEENGRLFSEFPPVPTSVWEERIKSDLKGADYDKKLIWKTGEGFDVKPYFRSADLEGLEYLDSLPGSYPYLRGPRVSSNKWVIRQDITDSDIETANRKAKEAISKGAEAIGLNSTEITTHKQMQQLLAGIDFEKTEIHFISSRSYPLTLELFLYEVSHRGTGGEKIKGSLNFDFLGYLLLHGDFYVSRENNLEEVSYLLNTAQKRLPGFRVINVNGHYFQDSGSTLVQELGFALAAGNEYLASLTSKGFDADHVASRMGFTFSIGPNYFMEIAKLRAARLLWTRIVEKYAPVNPGSMKMYIHSQTAIWNKTIYDPYVNLLRTTTEGMSGILGNTDSLAISPFDIAYRKGDEFSARIARNQQLVMKEESYLDKIADPAAGSYYIENLTGSIAHYAWKLFLEVESKGGMIEAVKSGFIQETVEASKKQKESDAAQRKLILLGTNQYPNQGEMMLEHIENGSNHAEEKASTYKKLKPFRVAAGFEKLRLDTEKYVSSGKRRPAVFLLTFGNLAMLRARAGFISNFFGCAGYAVIDNPGFCDPSSAVSSALESGAEIVVLCSSDEEYLAFAGPVCEGIRKSNPSVRIVVAGYPKDDLEKLKEAGVDDFIHVRTNVLETLNQYQEYLGIHQ